MLQIFGALSVNDFLTKSEIETGLTKIGVTKADNISTEEFRMLMELFGGTGSNTTTQVPCLKLSLLVYDECFVTFTMDLPITGAGFPSQVYVVPWTQLGSVSRWSKWKSPQAIYSFKRRERVFTTFN